MNELESVGGEEALNLHKVPRCLRMTSNEETLSMKNIRTLFRKNIAFH